MTAGRGVVASKAQTDDTTRVSALVETTSRDVLGYFLRRVDSPDDAADLLGETLLVVWRRVADLPFDPLEARLWAFGIARRVLSTYRRAGARRVALADRLRQEIAVREAHVQPPDAGDVLAPHLLALHPLDQEIIRLVHWEGFTLVEASTVLGKRAATVRSRYLRARRALRHAIDERGNDS